MIWVLVAFAVIYITVLVIAVRVKPEWFKSDDNDNPPPPFFPSY